MFILDTNIVSAMTRPEADPVVKAWLDLTDQLLLRTTAITLFEIRYGLSGMPAGRNRASLEAGFEVLLTSAFKDNILAFDANAAEEAGRIRAVRKSVGRVVDIPDTMIGAIAVSRGLPLVTRNVRHFDDLPVTLINPWA